MSEYTKMANHVANSNIVGFRQSFENIMNQKMAEIIKFKVNESDGLSDEEKEVAKKAFSDGQKSVLDKDEEDDESDDENTDTFIFNSDMGLKSAKDIIKKYNDSHENNVLTTRVFGAPKGATKLFVIGDKVGRIYVKSLIKSVGGKTE